MVESGSTNAPFPENEGEFVALVLRYLDGLVTPDEVTRLSRELSSRSACRDLFVQLCRMHGLLNETLAPDAVTVKNRWRKRRLKAIPRHRAQASPGGASSGGARPAEQELRLQDPGSFEQGHPAAQPAAEAGAETVVNKFSGEDTIHTDPAKPRHPDPLPPPEGAPRPPNDLSLLLRLFDSPPDRE
jgi:anti-sigma factor RsiW